MIVSMVDDRALRFRQQVMPPVSRRQPRPTPQPVEPTAGPLDALVGNYLRTSGQLAEDQVKYGGQVGGLGSRTADLLTSQGGVSDSPGLRAGALAGDILLDPGWLIPAVGAAKAGQTAGRVANLAPDTRQLYLNSLMGRLYHGAKQTPPAVLGNRGPQPQNWFQADTFLTTSKPLARTYGSEGLYRARVPLDVAERTNLLNLYGNPDEHLRLANSPGVLDYLSGIGANAVRHQSGHGMGAGTAGFSKLSINPFTGRGTSVAREAIEEPVYAFLEPAGIQMTRMADRLGNFRQNFDNAAYRARFTVEDLIDRIRKTGRYDPDDVL
jgi:hypothetical protein